MNPYRNMVMLLAVMAQQHQPKKAGLFRAWEALRELHAAPIEWTRDRLMAIALTGCLGLDVVVPPKDDQEEAEAGRGPSNEAASRR